MTFLALQNRALEECGYDFSTASSSPRTRMRKRVNDVYRRILRRPGFEGLLRLSSTYTFPSVASTRVYGLPMALGRIHAVYELDNDQKLQLRTLDWIRRNDPGLTASGTPTVYAPRGWFPVHTQPSNASAVVVKSTSASDTGTARLEYLNASGQRLTSSVTMTGTTAATLVAAGVVEVTEFYVSAVAVGTITLYEDSDAGTALAVLPVGYASVRHLHIQLWPTPAAAITYYLDYTRELADLVQDTEEPSLPPDFHDMIWRGAVMDEWLLKDDDRAVYMRQLFDADIRDLNHWLWNHPDLMPGPDEQWPRYSRLGGYFPVGT